MQPEEYRAMFDLEDRLWWYAGMRRITAAMLEGHIDSRHTRRLLDAGCGTGYSLQWMKERLAIRDVFGVDASPFAAELWREKHLDTVAVASASELPFGEDEFDLLTCFDVIYQLTNEGIRQALSEMHRVLGPGGLLLIREPAYDWMRGAHDLAIGTNHRFTRRELCRLIRSEGFRIRRATYANTLLFGLAVIHRLLSRLRGEADSDVKPVPRLLNNAFERALGVEARLLRKVSFPLGLSVIVIAEKMKG